MPVPCCGDPIPLFQEAGGREPRFAEPCFGRIQELEKKKKQKKKKKNRFDESCHMATAQRGAFSSPPPHHALYAPPGGRGEIAACDSVSEQRELNEFELRKNTARVSVFPKL